MFNNYDNTNITNNLKITACSGGIYKTYKESWFHKFRLDGTYSNKLLNPTIYYNDIYDIDNCLDNPKVILLQMVFCGDYYVVAELILEEDFNKYFNNPNNILEREV